MNLAPIAIFVYNRPEHTKNLLTSLKNCELFNQTKIFIFSDDYKKKDEDDKNKVSQVRIILKKFFQSNNRVKIYYNKNNVGLYQNIINGIDIVFKKNNKIIVLEDDLILHKSFLSFMNNALEFYKNKKSIYQISGYSYPINHKNINTTYFLPLVSCWGWATWKTTWLKKNFLYKNNLLKKYYFLKKNKLILRKFNFNNTYNYFKILEKHIYKKNKTWGVLFYLNNFFNERLCVYPPYSLVNNRGFDGSGQNSLLKNNIFSNRFSKIHDINMSLDVSQNFLINKKIEFFFKKKLSFANKVKSYINFFFN